MTAAPGFHEFDEQSNWQVMCKACASQTCEYPAEADAIAAWNTRAPTPAALPGAEDALREAIICALANYFADATLRKRHERGLRDKGPTREAEAKKWNELREFFGVRGAMPLKNARGVIRKRLALIPRASDEVLGEVDGDWLSLNRSKLVASAVRGACPSVHSEDCDWREYYSWVRDLRKALNTPEATADGKGVGRG